ncbi:MAG: hypothetical protein MUE53_03110 [Chitinophagales bacterium]|jgi:hypothetical protein|nr:hypothetical protein [Chitinophagales bacterium]
MLHKIFLFELNYWKKRPITFIFPLILFALSLIIFTAENISIGGEAVYRNSPFALTNLYWILFMLSPLLMNAIVCSGITRDYEYDMHQILYSMPISKFSLLMGRFLGGVFLILIMFFVVIIADLISPFMPWIVEDYLGPFHLGAHIRILLSLILPNVLILGSILYIVAALSKSTQYSLLAAMVFVALYLALVNLIGNLDNKDIPAFVDPLGGLAIMIQTEKWTLHQKNNFIFEFDYRLLINRLIWFTIAIIAWIFAFRFSGKSRLFSSKNKVKNQDSTSPKISQPLEIQLNPKTFNFKNALNTSYLEFLTMLKSPVFFTVLGLSAMMMIMELIGFVQNDTIEGFATSLSAYQFVAVALQPLKFGLIFLVGNLVWKAREANFSDVLDALPNQSSQTVLSQIFAVLWYIVSVLFILMLVAIAFQFINGYPSFDWDVYLVSLWFGNIIEMFGLAMLSMLFQVLLRSKFLGFLLSVCVVFFESFFFDWLEIDSNLVGFTATIPTAVYSEFYGFGPYLPLKLWFGLYWTLFFVLMAYIAYLFYPRGRELGLKYKLNQAFQRFSNSKPFGLTSLGLFLITLGWLVYQTFWVNPFISVKEEMDMQSYYEKNYKSYDSMPIPAVVHADYTMDLYPEDRRYKLVGKLTLVNFTDKPIDTLLIHHAPKFHFHYDSSIGRQVILDDKTPNPVEIIALNKTMQSKDTLIFAYDFEEYYHGIENNLENERLLPNGSFLDYSSFTPNFGYDVSLEIAQKSDRQKYNLSVKPDNFPALDSNCNIHCSYNYLGKNASWATISSKITTSADQIAVAPGALVSKEVKGDRATYVYELNQPSIFFFSILSGRYNVLKDSINGVVCEVYYTPNHHENIGEMMKSLKKSIAYYSEAFGPYQLPVARIIEFPQFSSFAQAFPGTMPYSESVGFTSNLPNSKYDINEIFHIVAHEMAHQWWAHQIVGAMMQGATLLSESLAEYSSLKLLQKEYGDDMTAKFLKDANMNYVFSRSMESKKESSLLEVDNQPYIHYQKGSIVLYGIQQLMGELKFNQVLKNLISTFAYKSAPYPNAYELYNRLISAAPDSLHTHIREGIQSIVVWQNDILSLETKKLAQGTYETKVKLELKKWSSDPKAKQTQSNKDNTIGQEKEAKIDDYFDIALYLKGDDKLRYGQMIHTQRFKFTQTNPEVTIVSNVKPDLVVLDPNFLHIHKDPELNKEKVK